jgi:hypothetical protein
MRWETGIGRGAHCNSGVPPVLKGAVVDAGIDRRAPRRYGDEVPVPDGPSRGSLALFSGKDPVMLIAEGDRLGLLSR